LFSHKHQLGSKIYSFNAGLITVSASELSLPAEQSHQLQFTHQQECGPMPNVMAALPNIGGALCSTPQSLAHAHY